MQYKESFIYEICYILRVFDSHLFCKPRAVPSEDVLELHLIRRDNVSLVEAD